MNNIITFSDQPFLETLVSIGNHGPELSYISRSWMCADNPWPLPDIHLTHNPEWEMRANQEINLVKSLMPGIVVDAEHIGSTSIPNIRARGCIAINFAVEDVRRARSAAKVLLEHGYEVIVDIVGVYSLVIAYPDINFQIYFITKLQRQWHFKKAFRDYMRRHPDEAKIYEQTKIDIWNSCGGDDELYRHNKSEFVLEILKKCGYTTLYLKEKMEDGDYTLLQGSPQHLMTSWYGPNVFWNGGRHD